MKKIFILISVLILIIAVFTACEKKNDDTENTTTSTTDNFMNENYSLTEPSFTVGAVKTSEKFETGEDEYQISYYDENGYPAKLEIYYGNKLAYYCIASAADEMGNTVQQKYYTADGKFIAILDNGIFFDESGNRISEDKVQAEFDKLR